MAKPGQSSFRRILLSRILLLSVPILLIGVYVTYKKARSSLVETARQNLTESANKKSESIRQSIETLELNLVTASETVTLQSGSPETIQKFLFQLSKQLPTKIPQNLWSQQNQQLLLDRSNVEVKALLTPESSSKTLSEERESLTKNQLRLVFSTPVYDRSDQLRYVLSVESALVEQKKAPPGSFAGSTVIIDQDGTILAHPLSERIGHNIKEEDDSMRLKRLLKDAVQGGKSFQHLFFLEKDGAELLAGYSSIPSPLTNQPNHQWVIVAVQSRDNALSDLREIWRILFLMTLCLIAASVLATLYIARDLARPVEQLRDYALHTKHLRSTKPIPHNFPIREFNQLAEAIDNMVERMRAWAEELELAWKEAQAANQLKNEFLATTSHELRTPLNGIIGCIRLVRDGCCDDREEELDLLQRADEAAIHLLGIINDVLDIARIEAGKFSVVTEPVNLQKLLKEVIDLQAVPIQQKGLQFNIPDLKEPIPIRASPAKLKQVLLNVVGNATKFTESGSITITTQIQPIRNVGNEANGHTDASNPTSVASSLKPASQVVVTVRDTGIGIDPSQQSQLFKPFVMVDGSTTRKFGGTGLGLAISRNLMDLMGGSITLSSEGEGKGTTVEIVLPMIELALLPAVESVGSSVRNDPNQSNGQGIHAPSGQKEEV
jgi:two-component system sensor histidine kinase BarA